MALIEPWQIPTTATQTPSTFWLWGSDPADSNTTKKVAIDDLFRTSGAVRDVYVESDGAFRTSVVLHNTAAEWSLRNTSGGTLRFRNEDTTANVFDINPAAHDAALEVTSGGVTVMRGSGAIDPTYDARVAGAVVNNNASGTFCALAIIGGATGASQIQFGTSADDDFARFGWSHNLGQYQFMREGTATPCVEIDGAAPIDSLNVAFDGRIGMGTNPATGINLDVLGSSTPQIRVRTATANGIAVFRSDNDVQNWQMGTWSSDHWVLRDQNAAVLVMQVEAGAPAASLYIDSDGHVGHGGDPGTNNFLVTTTGTTALNAFKATGTNALVQLRLENDARAWDIQVQTNDDLEIQDVTGSAIPMTIEAGANADSLVLDANGDVMMGDATSRITGLTIRPGGDSGTAPGISNPGLAVINTSASGDKAYGYFIAGSSGVAAIAFGNSVNSVQGSIEYDMSTDDMIFKTVATQFLYADGSANVVLGDTLSVSPGSGASRNLVLQLGTAPSSSPANAVALYCEDVSTSAELKVRDEASNVTVLSPHGLPEEIDDPSIAYPWTMHHENEHLGLREVVNMGRVVALVEELAQRAGLLTEDSIPVRKVEQFAKVAPEAGQRLPGWLLARLQS